MLPTWMAPNSELPSEKTIVDLSKADGSEILGCFIAICRIIDANWNDKQGSPRLPEEGPVRV